MNSKEALAAAIRLRRLALEVDEITAQLNDEADACADCGSVKYRNWPQKQMKERTAGASQRLREIADVFERRQHDREFIGKEQV